MNKKNLSSNYDLQVDIGKKIFMEYDQEMLIRRFHLTADKMWIYLDYLHTPYRISRKTGQIQENLTEDIWRECRRYDTVMTIYDLLCYPKTETAPGLSGSWCPVSKFAVMGGPDALGFSQKYAVLFQNHIQQLQKACVSLGGIPQKSFASADLTCMIPVTSYFPVLLQFWEGDEEFPPKLMLLWDENSMAFLHYETTYYLQGDLLERLSQKL